MKPFVSHVVDRAIHRLREMEAVNRTTSADHRKRVSTTMDGISDVSVGKAPGESMDEDVEPLDVSKKDIEESPGYSCRDIYKHENQSTVSSVNTFVEDVLAIVDDIADKSDTFGESVLSTRANQLLRATSSRARATMSAKSDPSRWTSMSNNELVQPSAMVSKDTVTVADVERTYGSNPAITLTALAHLLWSSVIRPNLDTAIDATAGNGGDSVALARILFPNIAQETMDGSVALEHDDVKECESKAQLLCIDIQEEACRKTRSALEAILPPRILKNNVRVVRASHAPLQASSSVALVVYNLGYLPNSDSKEYVTTTEITLASLADAALLLRAGGMLSVMTYPRTNMEEHLVARTFLEGLALFSSNTQPWVAVVDDLCMSNCNDALRDRVKVTLGHVLEAGGASQTWRVHEYKKLGWKNAPILLTAIKIK